MAALVERSQTAPALPLPRSRFSALVVAESAHRRSVCCARLRSLGARDIIEAASGAEARVRGNSDGRRDLVVIEGTLSDGPALPLLADLRELGWNRVVLLTARDDPYAVRAALSAGVRGYVVTTDPATDSERVRVVPRHRPRGGSPDELSNREIEVIQLVAEGNSNRAIGEDLGLSSLTVKSHLARIARKLGTGDRAEMVALAMRGGLLR